MLPYAQSPPIQWHIEQTIGIVDPQHRQNWPASLLIAVRINEQTNLLNLAINEGFPSSVQQLRLLEMSFPGFIYMNIN